MSSGLIMALICAFVGIAYGVISIYSILAKPQGNEEMQRIANAIQEGAVAYLARQYRAISVVGVVLFIIVGIALDWYTAFGFALGALFSGVAGSAACAADANTNRGSKANRVSCFMDFPPQSTAAAAAD